jgi:TetR/AcrR family transcriptional repressor of nem operon
MANKRHTEKSKTRLKLLAAANALLKEKGFSGTSVQKVMSKAKLSHGGFYAYFRDKDRMVVEAVRWGMEQAAHQAAAMVPKGLSREEQMLQFFRFYLSPVHRERVAEGCPVAALSRDFGNARLELRKEFARELSKMIEQRRALFSDSSQEIHRKEWMGMMCTYVGAMILSRSTEGDSLSDEFLEAAFQFLKLNIKAE